MSYGLFGDDVLFFQRLLKTEGLYNKALDGIWGKFTEKGATEFYQRSDALKEQIGAFDHRTEKHICTLALKAQREARHFMNRLLSNNINAKMISGTRTYDEQNKLYRQGRYNNPGPIVTKARGGRSNHNFGIAWDIGIFTANGGYSSNHQDYIKAAEFGISDHLEWGGNWRSFPDTPHYQLKTVFPIAIVRTKFESGETYIA
ncbi:M15 family metallopeptidase [Neptunomonas qingdaonensis]|uniref:Peptidoglycan L-alanyl-D-glutamate endopeptidase CwlK n=1 Tax=Neptunomonas qingdaonensis TaxID=1045558 RepID=A0A1I2TKE9_9GAMM|nr:M15 family metallopeptidase [Neptunomonas qingdaonensis]SFG65394.1 peptidoglycan L-alanyl-D-glutamate endopeptidase CwlK [Neptunomonas qingdaonensis]